MLSALAGLDFNKLELLRKKPEKLAAQNPLVSNEIEVYLEDSAHAEEGPDFEKLQKELAEIESQIKRLLVCLLDLSAKKPRKRWSLLNVKNWRITRKVQKRSGRALVRAAKAFSPSLSTFLKRRISVWEALCK